MQTYNTQPLMGMGAERVLFVKQSKHLKRYTQLKGYLLQWLFDMGLQLRGLLFSLEIQNALPS